MQIAEQSVDAQAIRARVNAFSMQSKRGFLKGRRKPTHQRCFLTYSHRDLDNVRDFIASISHVGRITKRIEHRKMFIDGDEVCVIYNFVTTMGALGSTRIAQ